MSLVCLSGETAFDEEAPPAPNSKPEVTTERITVTAAKREQRPQDVPISVSVTNRETLEQAHISDILDLQTVVHWTVNRHCSGVRG